MMHLGEVVKIMHCALWNLGSGCSFQGSHLKTCIIVTNTSQFAGDDPGFSTETSCSGKPLSPGQIGTVDHPTMCLQSNS